MGSLDLTLYTGKIEIDPEEPDLIIEEDSSVLDDTSPAVNYKEVMQDFETTRFLSKPDLAMSMSDASQWFEEDNSWLTFVGILAIMVMALIPVIMLTLYKYCGVRCQFQKVNAILAKLLLINRASETLQPALAEPVNDSPTITIYDLDFKLIQIVLIVMTLTFTCYLIFKIVLWTFDYLNTKYLHVSSTGLTYLRTQTLDKTNIYLRIVWPYYMWICKPVSWYNIWKPWRHYTVKDNLPQEEFPSTKNPPMILLIWNGTQ